MTARSPSPSLGILGLKGFCEKQMGNDMGKFTVMVAAATLILPVLSGCATERVAPLAQAGSAADIAGYHLGSGDKLRITVYNEPALTGEYSVTPAGAVAFPLIGAVNVANHTIEQVTADITHRLNGGYVQDARVSIEVLNFRPFYILGEVNKPGEYPYSSGLTVEKAVALAGGFTYRANSKVVYVRRNNGPDEGSVSLRGTPVGVQPGDTIRIGERYF
jgi:polysaccharide export outer membrane protein